MPSPPTTGPSDDELGIVLLAAISIGVTCAALLAFTPAFFGSMTLTLLVLWAWGPLNAAYLALLFAFCACAYGQLSVGYQNIITSLFQRYSEAYTAAGVPAVVDSWSLLLWSTKAWRMFAPPGIVAGACIRFAIEDRRNSHLKQLLEAGLRPKWRPNLSRTLRRRWVTATSISFGIDTFGYEIATGKPVSISFHDSKRHTFVLGTTGGGKSNSIALRLENNIRSGRATLFADGKCDTEFGKWMCQFAEAHGQKTYYLDASCRTDSTCAYSPVAHGNATSKTNRIVALTSADATHPYYRKLEIGFLQTAFKTLHFAGVETDLIALSRYLSSDKLLALVRGRMTRDRAAAKRLAAEIIAQQSGENLLDGLRREIQNLAWSDVSDLFDTTLARHSGKSILTLPQARRERAFVYFGFDKLGSPEYTQSFGKLLFNDVKATTPLMTAPWLTAFDEFHGYVGDQAIDLANMARSFGVAALFSTISFSDLERSVAHGGTAFVNQFISAVNTYVFHQFNSPDDAELAARVIGTAAGLELTAQMIDISPTGAASARGVHKFREHPDNIKEAAIGQAVLLNKNNHTVRRIKVLLSEWEKSRTR